MQAVKQAFAFGVRRPVTGTTLLRFRHVATNFGCPSVLRRAYASLNDWVKSVSDVTSETSGEVGTLEYKVTFSDKRRKVPISPWHDIPLIAPSEKPYFTFNFVVEIPKDTSNKMEIDTKSPQNPIRQDVKDGQPRVYKYGPIPFNYGALPMTWEDPYTPYEEFDIEQTGDNDPLDVVEISDKPMSIGQISEVKVLGAYGLIDQDELDWKILTIDLSNPLADKIEDVEDIEKHMPGKLAKIADFFINYKVAEGKKKNKLLFENKPIPKHVALNVVYDAHNSWKKLVSGDSSSGDLWVHLRRR